MLGLSLRTNDIRNLFKGLLDQKKYTSVNREATMTNLVGSMTIEIVNASFIADEHAIFGEVNWDYVEREEEWYDSQSLNVNDFPGGAPAIWKAVADKDGFINSNYGWTIYSTANGNQYDGTSQYENAFKELLNNPESRRAIMIYTRPSMWADYNLHGRSDFMCTNTVQYLIRDGAVHAIVQMRSNDAVFGYKNDRAWQQEVLERLTAELKTGSGIPYRVGNLYWNVGSLHVYARHFGLVDPYFNTK
jgi:thymidylate synthase